MNTPENQAIEKEIQALHEQMHGLQQNLVKLHQKMTGEEVENFEFDGPSGTVTLSEMFGNKDEMIVLHNMGKGCPYCTLWADGYNGFTDHLNNRAAFAMTTADDFKSFSEFAEGRGWKFKYYSNKGENFPKTMGFWGPHHSGQGEGPHPGMSFFYKEGNKIMRKTSTPIGPGDLYCSVWHMFDRLNKGVNGWQPKYDY